MSIKEAMRLVREKNKLAKRRRGEESERYVDKALDQLVELGVITTSWNASGTDDRYYGIDRHVQLEDGTIIDLQVKSSRRGNNEARKNFPHIAVIEVKEDDNLMDLSNRIRSLIKAKLTGKF